MEVTVTLTLEEVNAVVATLAQLPFNQVHELLQKIRGQAIEQVQAAQQDAQQATAPAEA